MDNTEYLNSLIYELMADSEWEFPPEQRFFLVADFPWTLLYQ